MNKGTEFRYLKEARNHDQFVGDDCYSETEVDGKIHSNVVWDEDFIDEDTGEVFTMQRVIPILIDGQPIKEKKRRGK